MIEAAISKIQALAEAAAAKIAQGRIYIEEDSGATFGLERDSEGGESFTQLVPAPIPQPAAKEIDAHSLQAVVDYLKENRDDLDLKGVSVHVVSDLVVKIRGPLRANRDREVFVTAVPANGDALDGFLGRPIPQEDFVLKVQTLFRPGDDRAALLALAGNLTDEAVRVAVDDGVTQQVSTRAGTKAGTQAVKSPVMLIPLRSFPEVELAPVPFVVRVKTNGPGQPSTIALFDASGGAWRVDAIAKIAAFLKQAAGAERPWGLIA